MRQRKRSLAEAAAMPLLIGGAALIAADVARRICRRTQLFCPESEPLRSWNPADYGIAPEAVDEHWIETPDGELLHAWHCRAPRPIASGIFCHGNTRNLTHSADVIPHLLDAGFSVLFFDYRGFGKSTGRPTVNGVISDGVTAARFHETLRPKHVPSLLYGYSLGGAVAAQVIRRHPFDGLILQSTFTSFPAITRVLFPRLPLHHLAGNFFDTLSVLRRLRVPLLVLHGTDDEVVPCSMAHELFGACAAARKRIYTVQGGMHGDLYQKDADTLIWALTQFVAELPTHRAEEVFEEPAPFEQWADSALRAIRRFARGKIARA